MGAARGNFEEERIVESSELDGTHKDHGVHGSWINVPPVMDPLSLQRKEVGDSDLLGEEIG